MCGASEQLNPTCDTFRPGSRCDPTSADGYYGCAPPPPACDAGSQPAACDGDTLVECIAGSLVRTPCPDGLGCDPAKSGGSARCHNTPCPGGESCAAGVITACLGGAPIQIDCTAIGFTGCLNEGYTAHCVR